MSRLSRLTLLVIAIGLLAACATATPAPTPPPPILQTVVVPQTVEVTAIPPATNTPAPIATAPARNLKIMPLGDSITFGETDPTYGGYRHLLGTLLANDGYSIDFVGSQKSGEGVIPDPDNEGHPGWTIPQIKGGIDSNGWLENYQPDLILLHIGTNDIRLGKAASAPSNLSALLDDILKRLPQARVIVAQIIPVREGPNQDDKVYDAAIPGIAASKGIRVSTVDVQNILSSSDYADELHPNSGGYDKMARAWEPAIRAVEPLAGSAPSTPATPSGIGYVAGSTQKVCQINGETDRELNQPTVNQTETRFGLVGDDLGYSFEHNGKLFFLFGDSKPTATFKGKPNRGTDPPRLADDNDAIAFTTDTSLAPCIKLDFITDSIGAYKNPLVLNAQGKPAITLANFEVPIAGISDGGKMYVIFSTDHQPPGFSTRTVVGESDDDAITFHYLYDFSKGPDAKFINVAIAQGSDGYLYFWGTQGGSLYRKSPPFLARKPIGSMNSLNDIEYLHTVNSDGTPVFMPDESDATPLFHDHLTDAQQPADCMGELGAAWNSFVKRWVMLYNCLDDTPTNPRGVYMRTALQPWGPWSAAQTIFGPTRDGGYCHFIHRAPTTQNPTPCDNVSDPGRQDVNGGEYGPYIISRFTTGGAAESTIYYALSTWNPYAVVIMKSSIQATP